MSDDMKPKQFFIHNSKEIGEIKISGNLLFATTEKPIKPVNHEVIPVIELETTLQLMKEMGDVLKFYLEIKPFPDDGAKARLVLEKYRKFLEGIGK